MKHYLIFGIVISVMVIVVLLFYLSMNLPEHDQITKTHVMFYGNDNFPKDIVYRIDWTWSTVNEQRQDEINEILDMMIIQDNLPVLYIYPGLSNDVLFVMLESENISNVEKESLKEILETYFSNKVYVLFNDTEYEKSIFKCDVSSAASRYYYNNIPVYRAYFQALPETVSGYDYNTTLNNQTIRQITTHDSSTHHSTLEVTRGLCLGDIHDFKLTWNDKTILGQNEIILFLNDITEL